MTGEDARGAIINPSTAQPAPQLPPRTYEVVHSASRKICLPTTLPSQALWSSFRQVVWLHKNHDSTHTLLVTRLGSFPARGPARKASQRLFGVICGTIHTASEATSRGLSVMLLWLALSTKRQRACHEK